MLKARYTHPDTKAETVISAREYSADTHKGHVSCSEDGCRAQVNFRTGSLAEGGANPRRDHFYSLDITQHKTACPTLDPDYEQKASIKCSLEDAIARGMDILLNMNFKTTMRVLPSFNRESRFDSRNPYQIWQVQTIHAPFAMHNMEEALETLNRIYEIGGYAALSRTHIGHCGDLRPVTQIMMGVQDRTKTADLYREMDRDFAALSGLQIAFGFPRILGFRPSYASATRAGDNVLSSDRTASGLGHSVECKGSVHDTDIINQGGDTCIFAVPMLRKGSQTIQWQVIHQGMITRAKGPVTDFLVTDTGGKQAPQKGRKTQFKLL